MEPITHVLTGACLARAGLRRKTAYATVTMAVAAELPDIDTVWGWLGPVEGFAHHRGITHTLLGLPVEAAVLVGVVWAFDRWRRTVPSGAKAPSFVARLMAGLKPGPSKALKPSPAEAMKPGPSEAMEPGPSEVLEPSPSKALKPGPSTADAANWVMLYGIALIALASHLLLDWTNNYGVRPLYPFNGRWFAGSFVFIFDPWIFLLLVASFVMPWLFGLVDEEVGTRKVDLRVNTRRVERWSQVALIGIAAWWCLRFVEHARAEQIAMTQSAAAPKPVVAEGGPVQDAEPAPADAATRYLAPVRVWASPDPWSPFAWAVATDYGEGYQLSSVDLETNQVMPDEEILPKLNDDPHLVAALRSPLGRAYRDWSAMPVATVDALAEQREWVVSLRDLRFDGGWLAAHDHRVLRAVIVVDAQGRVVRQTMDGRDE